MENNENNQFVKYLLLLLGGIIAFFVVCFIIGNFVITEPNTLLSVETVSSKHGTSIFNPQTIISNMEDGKKDVFTKIEFDNDIKIPEENYIDNTFSDKELFNIVQYYFQSEWDDDPNDWRLVTVYYRIEDCKKGMKGIVSVSFIYEKIISVNEEEYVNVRGVGIRTWKNEIMWSDKVENRTSLSKETDWADINFYPMEVLDIAEVNGGYEVHEESENKCGYIVIAKYGNNRMWNVDYYDNDKGLSLLELEVDTKTGKVKK
jgi:hypothetical protein